MSHQIGEIVYDAVISVLDEFDSLNGLIPSEKQHEFAQRLRDEVEKSYLDPETTRVTPTGRVVTLEEAVAAASAQVAWTRRRGGTPDPRLVRLAALKNVKTERQAGYRYFDPRMARAIR